MAETKKNIPLFGLQVPVSEVPIKTADEHFNDYTLEDGSVLRVKSVATTIYRVEDQYLPDGNPVYIVLTNPVTSVQSSPLKRAQ